MIGFDQLNDVFHQLMSDGHLLTDISNVADTLAHSGIDITTLSDAQLEALLSSLSTVEPSAVAELTSQVLHFGSNLNPAATPIPGLTKDGI